MTIVFPGQRITYQNNKIWGLVQRLKTYAHLEGEEIMRELCLAISGQSSSKALTEAQADKVIEELEIRVKRARQDALSKREGEPSDPDAFHTQDQMDMMLSLFADLGWTTNAQQQGFYRRILGHKCRVGYAHQAVFPHTRGEMRKVTEALKAIFTRKYNTASLQEAIRTLLGQGTEDRGQETGDRGQGIVGATRRVALTEWELKFLRNLQEKLLFGRKLTPQMIRKLQEVCEKRGQGLSLM